MSIFFKRPLPGLLIFLVLVSALALPSVLHSAWASSPFTFKNFELSAVAGNACPNTAKPSNCANGAAEPAIRANGEGHFYASSENGLGAGTDAWFSTTSGLSYTALPSPDSTSQTSNTGFAPGGGDTDLAVAPVENAQGIYNVYVASLSLANVDVSTSVNRGQTWSLNPTGATIPGDDREWIAADGASKVCISYHDVATDNIDVDCSLNAGSTFTQLGDAIDTNHAFLINNNAIGNLAIDPNNHNIYQTFSGIDNVGEVACGEAGTCGYHDVWMAVSTNGGSTFTDYKVYSNPTNTVAYGHQFVNVSIDTVGNIYSVYNDNHNLFYSYSTNQGQSWSAPVRVNKPASDTAIFPWSTANAAGHLDIVWYGTSYYDGTNPPDNYPLSASWYVYFAQNLNATTAGSSFTQTKATPIIHFGGVCESGATCTGNRDLYDDFGVAANPITGRASIIYSDDQFTNTPDSPPPSTNCTPLTSNSSSCNHTSIATQTSGPGI